jgi:hypothetical protein
VFNGWSLELPVEVDPNVFDVHTIRAAWEYAGTYVGLAEMRPLHGRFKGTVQVLEADEVAPKAKAAKA